MDITTVIGLVIGLGALMFGFVAEDGSLSALLSPTAALIVFGGTLGVVMIGTPREQLRAIPRTLRIAFRGKEIDPHETIAELVELATIARREGMLALDEKVDEYEDEFFKNGLRLVVDGVDSETVRSILETELNHIEDRHAKGVKPYEQAGGYAPTMGIIGTVMGLVHVLAGLTNIDSLGTKIATAFIATLYGVASANVLYLPIASKLKSRTEEEVLLRELMIEGILCIQAGDNPNIVRQKLRAFLPPTARTARQEARESDGVAA
jgi:chemotaxis protein MotA